MVQEGITDASTRSSLFLFNDYSNSNCTGKNWCGLCCNGQIKDGDNDVKLLSQEPAENLIIGYSNHINFWHSTTDIGSSSLDKAYFGYCAIPPIDRHCKTFIHGIEYGDILSLTSTINKGCPPIYLMAFDCCGTCLDKTKPNYQKNLDVAIPVIDNGGAYTCLKHVVNLPRDWNGTCKDEQCLERGLGCNCWAYDNSWLINKTTLGEVWQSCPRVPGKYSCDSSKQYCSCPLGENCEKYPKTMQTGCKNWKTLQNGYKVDLGLQDPAEPCPTKAWTHEILKPSGATHKEFSKVFYNYYYQIFSQYYGNVYTGLQAVSVTDTNGGTLYTGEVTAKTKFYNPKPVS